MSTERGPALQDTDHIRIRTDPGPDGRPLTGTQCDFAATGLLGALQEATVKHKTDAAHAPPYIYARSISMPALYLCPLYI